jgi:glucose/arabinose dehydrogenase
VAETSRVFRLEDPDGDGYYQERTTVISGIAAGGNINRTLIFSPDWRHLYLAVGSSCNVCQEIDTRRASILRFNSDGSEGRVFTSGLRNPIGLTLQPDNERFLWVSNIERDGLKNDLPPETIYAAFFDANAGWPSCHAGRIVDPEFGENDACETELLSPKAELEYQTSPMGIAFYLGDQYPDEYHNNLFVALHGEGEGDSAAGYKIIRIPFGEKFHRTKNSQVRDFATGWHPEDNPAWGTPFDIKFDTSGNLYVSDDTAGVIYLISYQSE